MMGIMFIKNSPWPNLTFQLSKQVIFIKTMGKSFQSPLFIILRTYQTRDLTVSVAYGENHQVQYTHGISSFQAIVYHILLLRSSGTDFHSFHQYEHSKPNFSWYCSNSFCQLWFFIYYFGFFKWFEMVHFDDSFGFYTHLCCV